MPDRWRIRSFLLAIMLTSALCISVEAQPKQPGLKEIVSAAPDVITTLPAAAECGMTTITTSDGTTVRVPKQGRFVQRCENWRIVDGKNNVLSTGRRCGPLVFTSC